MRTCLVSGSGLLAIFALAACGGTIELPPGPCESSAPKTCSDPEDPKRDPNALPASSSQLLVFDTVTRSDGMGNGYPVTLPNERASIGNQARLDLDNQSTGSTTVLKASLAPRWGAATELTAALPTTVAKKLTLNGKVTFSSGGEQNDWTSITLDLDSKGELAGTFTAVGMLQVFMGDYGESYPVTGTGHLAKDALSPEMRLAKPNGSRNGKYLPWDALNVELGEPLHLTNASVTSSMAGIDWSLVQDNAAGWNSGLVGTAKGFDLAGQTVRLLGPASATDPSHNPIDAFMAPVAYQSLGTATERHDLDSGLTGAVWGTATFATDARCEKGGCVVFPSISANECGGAPGFGGLLGPTVAAHTLHARVRVFAADRYVGSGSAPFVYQPYRIEVVSAAGTVAGGAPPSIDDLAATTEDPDFAWATPWKTIDVPLPQDGTQIGFAIVRPLCDSGSGGLPYPDSKVSVRIDDVWAD